MKYEIVYSPDGRWEFVCGFQRITHVIEAVLALLRSNRDFDFDWGAVDELIFDLCALTQQKRGTVCSTLWIVTGRLRVEAREKRTEEAYDGHG